MKNSWNEIPYPGEDFTPIGETPSGGSWPIYYFKRDEDGGFTDLDGNPIAFNIKNPESSDKFNTVQLQEVIDTVEALTEEQKEIAKYWGTGIPQNKLIPIVQCLINSYSVPPLAATRMYCILCNALNDAMVICWHYKYTYQIPRPAQYKQDFMPYLKTPMHPSYPAGHAVSAGCLEGILSHFFPKEGFKIAQLGQECSISRLYAGVHYPMDLEEGYRLGLEIAYYVLKQVNNSSDKYGATANIIYRNFKDAKLMPPPYKPIDFCGGCQ